MPLQNTSGSDTTDAYGGGAAAVPNYIEQVFSTYLYTGNGSTQSINNSIDLSTKGGLVWVKGRSVAGSNTLYDTARGVQKQIFSDLTSDTFPTTPSSGTSELYAFNTNGFSLGADDGSNTNTNAQTFVSWTFRKQPKFFDIVTYTGDGNANRAISHNLGSTPGCIIIKCTNVAGYWFVYHQSNGTGKYIFLNTTGSVNTNSAAFPSVTSTTFTPVGSPVGSIDVNTNGSTYVAYIFASNAGGFGLTGTDNVITCGSFTVSGYADTPVTLGYEPQFVLYKCVGNIEDWVIQDNMRGMSVANGAVQLYPDSAAAEVNKASTGIVPTATGFIAKNYFSNNQYIYIAIRRGPMAVPTDPTTVFSPNITSNDSNPITTNFPVDFYWDIGRAGNSTNAATMDRLRGSSVYLSTSNTNAEANSGAGSSVFTSNTTVTPNFFLTSVVVESFRRAPGFFDEVCYTGTTSDNTQNHNLTVIPELIIFKRRNAASSWGVFSNFTSTQLTRTFIADNPATTYLYTDGTGIAAQPTTTQIVLTGGNSFTNVNGGTYVAYLFATCPGVSKVGNYTGNGSTQAISCGFTGGARFVLIHRQDSGGSSWPWYVYDTARGMTTLTDPYILLDSTSAETATLGSVTTTTGGFTVNASILSAINTNAASYIFIAIS